MFHPWMVEIPRPFDGAQGMLQAKKKSVMPAQAGIQRGGGGANTQNLDSRFRGKDGMGPKKGDSPPSEKGTVPFLLRVSRAGSLWWILLLSKLGKANVQGIRI